MVKREGDGGNHVLTVDIHVSKREAQRPDFEELLAAKLESARLAVLAVVESEGWRL